jgi:hypothetical protein
MPVLELGLRQPEPMDLAEHGAARKAATELQRDVRALAPSAQRRVSSATCSAVQSKRATPSAIAAWGNRGASATSSAIASPRCGLEAEVGPPAADPRERGGAARRPRRREPGAAPVRRSAGGGNGATDEESSITN